MNVDVEELEAILKEENKKLEKLENEYEKEEDEKKFVKLEHKISQKEEQIYRLEDRQQALLDKEAESETEGKDEKAEEKEDTDVCSLCGGDLLYVETSDEGDIYECVKCHELYLDN